MDFTHGGSSPILPFVAPPAIRPLAFDAREAALAVINTAGR